MSSVSANIDQSTELYNKNLSASEAITSLGFLKSKENWFSRNVIRVDQEKFTSGAYPMLTTCCKIEKLNGFFSFFLSLFEAITSSKDRMWGNKETINSIKAMLPEQHDPATQIGTSDKGARGGLILTGKDYEIGLKFINRHHLSSWDSQPTTPSFSESRTQSGKSSPEGSPAPLVEDEELEANPFTFDNFIKTQRETSENSPTLSSPKEKVESEPKDLRFKALFGEEEDAKRRLTTKTSPMPPISDKEAEALRQDNPYLFRPKQ